MYVLDTSVVFEQRCVRLNISKPWLERDAVIAATALFHGMIIVTRNLSDFHSKGADLCNPWVGA